MKGAPLLVLVLAMALGACQPAVTTESPTPTTAAPPTAAQSASTPTAKILGEPVAVYTFDTDKCNDHTFVDLPARAVHMANGMIELYLSSTTSYRMVGPNFDSLKVDCNAVFTSDMDRNPADYNWEEWMGSPYTLDGKTVYAIIHQEYHGDQAGSIRQASGDFGSEQGGHDWTYLSSNGSSYIPMTYDDAHRRWQGARPLCQVYSQGMHPDIGCEPVRAWTSPVDETVTVAGRVYDQDAHAGNGIRAKIRKGTDELWSATIENADSSGQSFDLRVPVKKGDVIYFSIDARGDSGWDSTFFDPGINLGPPPCPSGKHSLCTLISLTYAISTDGGATFTQPSAPDHLIAAFPYPYDPDWMRALWQPSNIVKNPNDDYYYALIQFDEHGDSTNIQGMCLLRTQTLDDPKSWRAWDGTGFDTQFIDPYGDTIADPAQHTCSLVDANAALTYGLSYNTYLQKFIAIGVRQTGFYYELSDDLIHWDAPVFLMKAAQTFTPGAQPPYLVYPTLIDPTSTAPSFDTTGQKPYLYFTRMNDKAVAFNTDLMRVQIEFAK
jgi:hypothetical protein